MFKNSLIIISAIFFLIFVSHPNILPISGDQSEPVNLSNTSGESRRVQIFVNGNDVYSVWTDNTPGNNEIFFAKSTDYGNSFDSPINLSQNNGSSAFPRLVVSESNVYIVWYDYSLGQSDIFFARSNDKGKTFNVTSFTNSVPSYNPWIGTSSNFVYLVFNDGGRTTTVEFPSGEKRLVDLNTGEEELIIGRSEDGGESFEFINLSDSPGITSWNARIKVSGPNVFVVWNEMVNKESEIFFSMSTDNGKTFSEPINVSNNTKESINAGLAVSENNIYLIWNQKTPDSIDIFFTKSTDYGNIFSTPINLSNSLSVSAIGRDLSIAVSDEKLFVVWYTDSKENSDVFFTRSLDGGLNFSTHVNLSQSDALSKYSQVVVNEKNVYVVWHDYSQGNGDIFLRESTDYGATFGSIKNLSNDEQESNIFILGPQIALSEDRVFVAWQNKVDGNADLYLKSISQSESQIGSPLLLSTLNEAVNVELSFEGNQLEADKTTNFTLRFLNPLTGSPINEVNYSIEVLDTTGKKVVNMQNLYAKTGIDTQSIIFLEKESFTFIIDIKGTGAVKPYDTKNSGMASATITVVPEFPLGVIISLGALIGLGIIITFLKTKLFVHKNLLLEKS
jgi:hypothetical protein